MNSIEISEKKMKIDIPSHWDECTAEQVEDILKLAFSVMNGTLSLNEFRIKVFVYLSGLKLGLIYLIKQRLGLNNFLNQRIYLLSQQLCGWVFSHSIDDKYELNFNSICNPFAIINSKFHGPDDLLSDITFLEFKSAIGTMNEFFEAKEDPILASQLLDLFIATLYRPLGNDEQKVPFNKHIINAANFENVPAYIKHSILLWFSFCVKTLQEDELTINGIDVDLSVLFPKGSSFGKKDRGVNLGWHGVLLDIAEEGVFGDAEKTGNTLLYDILIFLLKKHQDIKKANKK